METMEFSHRLYQLRRARGLSQEELAHTVGVSRQAVQKWEAGASAPDLDNLSALADYFGVTLDYLVRGGEAVSPPPPEEPAVTQNYFTVYHYHYEYRSRRTLFGLPLVHIHLGYGFCRARGIVAIGNIATGVISLGCVSTGAVSIGGVTLGALALGGLAAGLFAFGGLALGVLLAVGGGALSLGVSLGGAAVSRFVAQGGLAVGQYAAGDAAFGSVLAIGNSSHSNDGLALTFTQLDELGLSPAGLLSWLREQVPHAPAWVLRLLLTASGR